MTKLYRHYDAEGRLLYVGISINAMGRLEQHLSGSHWCDDIASVTIERFTTEAEAREAERCAIRTEKPLHNIQFNKVPTLVVAIRAPKDVMDGLAAKAEAEAAEGRKFNKNAFIVEAVREEIERRKAAAQ